MRKTRSNGVGDMRLVQLMPNYDLTKFDCGDEDLNDFLRSDSISCVQLQICQDVYTRR